MEKAWVVEIRDQCLAAGVPFFFKQWGGVNKKKAGRILDGQTWDDLPRAFGCTPIYRAGQLPGVQNAAHRPAANPALCREEVAA
jgi:hypothetical protein